MKGKGKIKVTLKATVLIAIALTLIVPSPNMIAKNTQKVDHDLKVVNVLNDDLSNEFLDIKGENSEFFNSIEKTNRGKYKQSPYNSNWVGNKRITNNPNSAEYPNIESDFTDNNGKLVDFSADNSFDNAYIRIGYDKGDLIDIAEETLLMCYWDLYNSEGPRWVVIDDSGVNT